MHCLYLGTFITVMARRRPSGEWSQLSASSNLKYSIKAEEGSHWAGLGWTGLGVEAGQRPAKYFKRREEDEFQCCQAPAALLQPRAWLFSLLTVKIKIKVKE